MSYTKEVMDAIKDLRERIENCEDPLLAIELQEHMLDTITCALTDNKFKESLAQKASE